MAKAVLIHHDRGRGKVKQVLCIRIVDYSSDRANRLREPEEFTELHSFNLKKYKSIFGKKAVETNNITEQMQRWMERIRNKPISKPGGWRGTNATSTEEFTIKKPDTTSRKISWGLNARQDVRDRITEIAQKRNITTAGLVENILIKWINENETASENVLKGSINTRKVYCYRLGQLAAIGENLFGNEDLYEYIKTPWKKITELKKKMKGNKIDDVVSDFLNIASQLMNRPIEQYNQIYFFAGYCGTDISVFWDV